MSRRKKIIIAAVLAAAAAAIAAVFILGPHDPNSKFKKTAAEIAENEAKQVKFSYDPDKDDDVKLLPGYFFVPSENSDYRFTISDIHTDDKAALCMYVTNEDFTDYMATEVYLRDDEEPQDTVSGDTFIQKGELCYIMISVVGEEGVRSFDGSFTLTVSRAEEEEQPEEISAEGSVTLNVPSGVQKCAVFTPEESGYFRFDSSITSEDGASGFSSISSVTSDDNKTVKLTEGIVRLEQGRNYYIWVTVNETGDKRSEVLLTCRSMETVTAEGACELEIKGNTVIEYTAADSRNLAVYSVSKGDPAALIFEKEGFPLRMADNAEPEAADKEGDHSGLLSDNENDFAMVFGAERGRTYRICVYGDPGEKCRVFIVPYTGDGTTLTQEDVGTPDHPASDSEENSDNSAGEAE